MTNQIAFTETFALATGPNGSRYVADMTEPGRFISIDAFLFQRFNPWSAEEKAALRRVCKANGIDVSRPSFAA